MPINWTSFQQRMDRIVDNFLGEPIEIYPWTGGDYSSGGNFDSSRPVVKTVGLYVTPGTKIIGEEAWSNTPTVPMVENATWCSIQLDLLDPSTLNANDRFYFPMRDEWYELVYSAPSATRRPNYHLTRLNAAEVVLP